MSQSGGGGVSGSAGKWIGALVGGVIAVGAVAYTVLTGTGAAATVDTATTDDAKHAPATSKQANAHLPRAMPAKRANTAANTAANAAANATSGTTQEVIRHSDGSVATIVTAAAAAEQKHRHRPSLVGISKTDPLFPVLTRLYASVTAEPTKASSAASAADMKSAPAPPGGAATAAATATAAAQRRPPAPVPKWVPPGYVSPNASLGMRCASAPVSAAFDAVAAPVVYTALYRYLRVPDLARLRGVNRAWRAFGEAVLYQPTANGSAANPYLHHHAARYGFGALAADDEADHSGGSRGSGAAGGSSQSAAAAAAAAAAERRRGGVWTLVSGAERTLRTVRSAEREQHVASLYRELLARKGKSFHDVQKDYVRTLIHHSAFADEAAAERALQNLLNAYSIHDVQVGYCQGMNFLAAFVLTKLPADEERAYWTWYTVMHAPRHNFRTFYFPDLQGLHLHKYQWTYLFEGFLPALHAHFLATQVPADALTEWWMTLFTFRAFPRATAARIWDLMLVDGGAVTLFRVALAVLALAQDALLQCDMEGVMEWTKSMANERLPDPARLLPPDAVVAHALSFEVTDDLLAQLTAQYWNQFAE